MKKNFFYSFLLIIAAAIVLLSGCASNAFTTGGTSAGKPKKIALLLPLSGNLSSKGQAIRNGFFTAYYYDKQQNTANVPTITVIDTNQGNIQKLYQQAVADGANVIVGPLTKPNLETLAHSTHLSVPTLALNNLENNTHTIPNLYQFSLSPDDEAQQAAERAWRAGYRRILVIAPQGQWGQGVSNSFKQRWQSQGGLITNTIVFNSVDSAAQLTAALQNKNFDAIFLLALPNQARQIQTLIRAEAGWAPVYATSTIYNGMPSAIDVSLDGVFFCDMPWVLNDPAHLPPNLRAMRQRITTIWPSSFTTYPRLYAFGIDAYSLAANLSAIQNGDEAGATGVLSLAPYQQIYRRLEWAQMRKGQPQRL